LKIGGRLGSRLVLLYCHCFHAVNFSRGLSRLGHDDEQGADHSDEDQRIETDPHPLLRRPVFPDHFGFSPLVSHMMRSQYIAVRICPRFVTGPVPGSAATKKGKLAIEIAITKDGKLAGVRLVATTGDTQLDRAAWGGITACSPFKPLPEKFTGPYLALRMRFYYNPDKSEMN
jgi:TonB family protein